LDVVGHGLEEHGELVIGWDGKLEEVEVGKIFFELG
jgi:hypothetical protein